MEMMIYKGFNGTIEFSEEDGCYFGKVLNVDGLVLYEGSNIDELRQDFQNAVDDYMTHLKEMKANRVN